MILKCYDLLKKIETRPAMRIGEMSLKAIDLYVRAYYTALVDYKIYKEPPFGGPYDPFFDWVAEKLGYYESTAGWANMILAYSIGFEPKEIDWETFLATSITFEQHCASIKLFYELVEEFKNEMDAKK